MVVNPNNTYHMYYGIVQRITKMPSPLVVRVVLPISCRRLPTCRSSPSTAGCCSLVHHRPLPW
uniref:Uncharacterized protein n=1 Tax=Oryza barthii TaxID=65489 RepID=A0A0D3FL53_9ORYZ